MEIAENVCWGVFGFVAASIWWLYWALNWPSHAEREWEESRQILLDKIDDLKVQLARANDETQAAYEAKYQAQGKVDELRDALYRVYDVARCWDDNPEA